MACKCFENLGAQFKKHLTEHFGDDIGEIDEACWTNSVFVLAAGDHSSVTVPYTFRFFKRKRDGSLAQRCTDGSSFMTMAYCPFCGTKFEGKPKEEAADGQQG